MTYISRSLPFSRRPLGRVVALAAIIVGLLVAGAGTAHAYSNVPEGFEFKHSALKFGYAGTGGSDLILNRPWMAKSGKGWVDLWTRGVGSWSTVERTTSVNGSAGCTATAYVGAAMTVDQKKRVNLEVIDPTTWRYIRLTTHEFVGHQYRPLSMYFQPGVHKTVVVRVVLVSPGNVTDNIKVDDLTVECIDVA